MTPDLLRRIAALNLDADKFQEVLSIVAEAAEKDRAKVIRSDRNRRYYDKRLNKTGDTSELDADKTPEPVLIVPPDPIPRAGVLCGAELKNIPPEKATLSTPKGKNQNRSGRGTRLPEGWRPSDEGRLYAVEILGSNSAARTQLENFCDHWLAKAGPDARKVNWELTWRRWVRRALELRPPPNGPPRKASLSPRMQALSEIYDEQPSSPGDDEAGPEIACADASGGGGRVIGWIGRAG